MIKYSTPSIEVVNFSSSDAPRIGMQWWVQSDSTGTHVNLGSWIPASTNLEFARTVDRTPQGVDCSAVDLFRDYEDTVPGGFMFTSPEGRTYYLIVDDGKSC